MQRAGQNTGKPQTHPPSEDVKQRKRTEEALRKSEERWRSVFENSAIGVALTDLNGRFLATNPTYQRMLGYTDEEFQTVSFLDITHEDHRAANLALVTELLEGKREQFQIEKQCRRKDGDLIWVRNNVSLVPGTESMPQFIMTLSEDITERKQAEEALQKSEERIRLILESSAEGIFGCDPNGNCLFCNQAAVGLLGYKEPVELLGKNMHSLEHHTRKDGTPFPIDECPIYVGFHENRGVHIDDDIFWRKDGTSFPAEYWSHPMVRDGKTVGAVITFFDITERKKAEEALRKSEQRKRSLLEINNAIINNLTQEALFTSAYEAIRRVVPFDRAAFLLYQPETKTLKLLSMNTDTESEFFKLGKEYDLKETRISAWVLDRQLAVVRGDLEKEQQSPGDHRLVAEGIQSYCVVPLVAMGNSIGTFTVWSEAKHRYSEADAELLQEVANQVALAIANMKSYEEIASLKARLEKENVYLQEEIRTVHNFEEIVGNSPTLLELLRRVDQVAPTDSSVLIYGETGTGKELIARAIHDRSMRKNRPPEKVNCRAISRGWLEGELFGHVKGAFTGAVERRIGRFELADGGTLFLDEVGELPLETQVKLLRVLQEQEFEPIGSSKTIKVNVRVIAATNRDLNDAISEGKFRSDLFYRLNVFPLSVPPLRERTEDIPLLVTFSLQKFAKKLGRPVKQVTDDTMRRLAAYLWPRNIRELQNVIERAILLSSDNTLTLAPDFGPMLGVPASAGSAHAHREILASAPVRVPPAEAGTPNGSLEDVERR